jgi:hypothetical protein
MPVAASGEAANSAVPQSKHRLREIGVPAFFLGANDAIGDRGAFPESPNRQDIPHEVLRPVLRWSAHFEHKLALDRDRAK